MDAAIFGHQWKNVTFPNNADVCSRGLGVGDKRFLIISVGLGMEVNGMPVDWVNQ